MVKTVPIVTNRGRFPPRQPTLRSECEFSSARISSKQPVAGQQCDDMFSFIRKAKILIPFFYERMGDYAELARMDLVRFRNETIHSIAGAVLGAAAVLLLLSFIGIAAIVTEWDTPNRVLTAWLVVVGWTICTGACLYVAGRLTSGSPPFADVGSAISSDLAAIKNPGNGSDVSHSERFAPAEGTGNQRVAGP